MDVPKALEYLEEHNVEFVRVEICDMYGISRSKLVPSRHFKRIATSGMYYSLGAFAWDPTCSVMTGTGLLEEVSFCDMRVTPDLDTLQVVPWLENTARVFISSSLLQGGPVIQDPRYMAKVQLDRLEEMGLSLLSAHEYEFYVKKEATGEPLTKYIGESLTISASKHHKLIFTLMRHLTKIGIDIESFHPEEGPGQLEMTFRPSFGLKACDNAFGFKTSVKEICQQHGYIASFISKPDMKLFGSSCHFCHSLWNSDGSKSVLYDPKTSTGLSKLGEHWVAGLVTHARAITIFCSPTVNCLKRLKPYTFAPINSSWGIDNRTTAFRVKVDGNGGTYFENRIGAGGSNPYLVLAATVAAGLDGIQRELALPEPIMGSAYKPEDIRNDIEPLPTTMEDAIKALVEDDVIFETFGADFIKTFVALKQHEMKLDIEAKASGKKNWDYDMFFDHL